MCCGIWLGLLRVLGLYFLSILSVAPAGCCTTHTIRLPGLWVEVGVRMQGTTILAAHLASQPLPCLAALDPLAPASAAPRSSAPRCFPALHNDYFAGPFTTS